ncbi:hypothetical protein MKX01_021418 [Papaver californicum]|nr:hypothetical protein MKX01_021418 [Papaver californicum]
MEEKSRILIIGVTGNLGFKSAEASLKSGHPTFALVRDSSYSVPEKSQKLQLLANSGASLLHGSLEAISSLIEAVKQVDVVICAVSPYQVLHQKLLIQAIRQSGCIKSLFHQNSVQIPIRCVSLIWIMVIVQVKLKFGVA